MTKIINFPLRILALFPLLILLIYFTFANIKVNKNYELQASAKIAANRKIQRLAKLFLFFMGVKIKLVRQELYCQKPALVVSNHRSYFDAIILIAAVAMINPSINVAFIAKIESKKILIIKILRPFMNILFLDRKNIRQALELFSEAKSIITEYKNQLLVFPEGRRSLDPKILQTMKFSPGAFKVAYSSACPIQPVMIINHYCNKYRFFLRRKTFKVVVIPPLRFSHFSHIKTIQLATILRNKMNKIITNEMIEKPVIIKSIKQHQQRKKLKNKSKK